MNCVSGQVFQTVGLNILVDEFYSGVFLQKIWRSSKTKSVPFTFSLYCTRSPALPLWRHHLAKKPKCWVDHVNWRTHIDQISSKHHSVSHSGESVICTHESDALAKVTHNDDLLEELVLPLKEQKTRPKETKSEILETGNTWTVWRKTALWGHLWVRKWKCWVNQLNWWTSINQISSKHRSMSHSGETVISHMRHINTPRRKIVSRNKSKKQWFLKMETDFTRGKCEVLLRKQTGYQWLLFLMPTSKNWVQKWVHDALMPCLF